MQCRLRYKRRELSNFQPSRPKRKGGKLLQQLSKTKAANDKYPPKFSKSFPTNMPPLRRKSTPLADHNAAPPDKRAKTTNSTKDKLRKNGNSASLIWQYKTGKNFKSFLGKEVELINDSFKKSRNGPVKFVQSRVGPVSVDVHKMTKINETSGRVVKIRYAVTTDPANDSFVWTWTDLQGEENLFAPFDMVTLENSFVSKSTKVSLAGIWSGWKIHFKNMKMSHKTSPSLGLCRVSLENCTFFEKKKREKPKATAVLKCFQLTSNCVVPVDANCSKVGVAHVYCEGDDIWDVMLNQTNIELNCNKFYLMQLLKDNNKEAYSIWARYGRIGRIGFSFLKEYGPCLETAKEFFRKTFADKTKNNWDERDTFDKITGKYDLIDVNYSTDDVEKKIVKKLPKTVPESKLDVRVRALIELIFNVDAMKETMIEMEYDAKQAPLGRLTADQISAGYAALKVIDKLIRKNVQDTRLFQACNDFYTRIPHSFCMKKPPLISTAEEVRKKMALLEALGDIQVALKMMNEVSAINEHPADKHYRSLHCELTPLDEASSDFKLIKRYLKKTHSKVHSGYKLQLLEAFECKKELDFRDVGNRMLLWHGSRLTNWAGILSHGLRIAPREAPLSGFMFGKGVYFSDISSKSANYCHCTCVNNIGLLLLCEVALGEINRLIAPDYYANRLPSGKDSVMGVGGVHPDNSTHETLLDGTLVPVGTPVVTPPENPNYVLWHNEYIVYDTRQIRMRYLVKVQFIYK